MKPNYTAKIESFKRKNIAAVERRLPKVKADKAREDCLSFHFSEKEIDRTLEFLNSDSFEARAMRILHYAKKPNRQNVYEAAFLDFLNKILPDYEVRSLPGQGRNALYAENGRIVFGAEKSEENRAKSFDFLIEGKGRRLLIAHKFTNEEGGAQDNQYNDLIEAGKQSRGLTGDTGVILVSDGPYYHRAHSRESRFPRLHFLRDLVKTESNVSACSGDEFAATIADLDSSMVPAP